jgi:hypothetical protein
MASFERDATLARVDRSDNGPEGIGLRLMLQVLRLLHCELHLIRLLLHVALLPSVLLLILRLGPSAGGVGDRCSHVDLRIRIGLDG